MRIWLWLTSCLVAGLPPLGARAQTRGDVRLEVGTATALPTGSVEDDAAVYGLAGLGLDWSGERARLSANVYGGMALNGAAGGDFASASMRIEGWSASSGPALGLIGRAYGFDVGEPYPYRNGTIRGGGAIRWLAGSAGLEVRGEVGSGASEVRLRRRPGQPLPALEKHLWHRGAMVEGHIGRGDLTVSATAGTWTSAGGAFRSVELGITGGGARVAVRGDLGWWDTPLGSEWTGGLAVVIPLGRRWSVQAAGGRSGPDPLTLVEAGGQGGVLIGWMLTELGSAPAVGLYELGGRDGVDRFVSFRLERQDAVRVELIGGFTGWEPRPMSLSEGAWRLELRVSPGTHHFGFLVDGEWYVPDGVPGNVPDDWGRTNATLVVPPA